jgi:hypothetical protein
MTSLKSLVPAAALTAALLPASVLADVVVSNDPTQNMNCVNGSCAPTHSNAVLNVADLTNMLAAGDVTLGTRFGKRKHQKDAHYIDIEVPVSWTSSGKLTLAASDGGRIDAPMTVMGTGSLAMGYYYYLASGASVTFWDLSSSLTIDGASYTLVGDVSTLASDIVAAQGKGNYALANDYDAAGDNFQKAPIPNFSGTLIGLRHSISNLKIRKGSGGCQGLISNNQGFIEYLQLHAVSITSTTQKSVGSLAGCNGGNIYYVSVDGTVKGNNTANVGGIAGANDGSIAIARVAVSVSGGQTGGIVGENDSGVSQAYASGSVTGQSNVGGLVGANKSYLQNSYSTAAVNGNGGTVGSLAGFNGADITDCYAIGTVSGTGIVGGLVGYDPNESVSNGYWDLDTSGINDPNQGAGLPKDDTSITGLTTAQLQARLPNSFLKTIWGRDPNINNGFPYLLAVPPQ